MKILCLRISLGTECLSFVVFNGARDTFHVANQVKFPNMLSCINSRLSF